jgi:hypothetical protein
MAERLVILNIPASKIGAILRDPKTQNDDFLKNGSNDFGYFSVIYGVSFRNKTEWMASSGR